MIITSKDELQRIMEDMLVKSSIDVEISLRDFLEVSEYVKVYSNEDTSHPLAILLQSIKDNCIKSYKNFKELESKTSRAEFFLEVKDK